MNLLDLKILVAKLSIIENEPVISATEIGKDVTGKMTIIVPCTFKFQITGMKTKDNSKNFPKGKRPKAEALGYPLYPASEDIYKNVQKIKDVEWSSLTKSKEKLERENFETTNGVDFEGESEEPLDVPGAELDDESEDIGSEDEENNYYSLGGDAHDDLDENQGD